MATIKAMTMILMVALTSATAVGQNVLVNGEFESHPAPLLGNNPGWSIAPWVMTSSAQPNVIQSPPLPR